MSVIDRNHPAIVTLEERYPLTLPGSSKTSYHIKLNLKNSGLHFKPGDSLGIFAQNDPLLVKELLQALNCTGKEEILHQGAPLKLLDFLTCKANLFRLTSGLFKLCAPESSPSKDYLAAKDPLHFFKEYDPTKVALQELCAQFAPLLPRFYSVASSLKTQQDSVDLLVALLSFTQCGENRFGVASHFLCHLAEVSQTPIPVYVQPAHRFGLPEDLHAPLIMVGPGTGVAPFRAFLQERMHLGSQANHWLFFGERNRQFDFFYEHYWNGLIAQNKLHLDLAFSRDQNSKVYVQHKMHEKRASLWRWLQEGAYFYVCGDASQMAKDVDAMLHTIAQTEGGLTIEQSKAYIKNLRQTRRYLLDVY